MPVQVGGPRQQIVLCVLLSEPDRVVPVDRLVDAIWGEAPPATARSQVQICVSALRRGMAPDRDAHPITTDPPGYTLHLRPGDSLDLELFGSHAAVGRAAAADGRPGEAVSCMRQALALWRGEPFGGLGVGSAVLRERAVLLGELRSALLAECIELELAAGHHAEVVAELRSEVDRDPLQEHFRQLLMIALHGTGRQAEALREYRIARELMVGELGIEPGAELRRLEQSILTGDLPSTGGDLADARVAGPRVRPAPRMLPAAVADFTGRGDVAVPLLAHLAPGPAESLSSPVAVVMGGAGVGKTALAVHLAHRVAAGFPGGQLYADLHGASRYSAPEQVLERFLRALGEPANALPPDHDERVALYRQHLADRPVLICLDDVWSEDQIADLLPGGAACSVLVTSRRRLTAIPGALRVELAPFSTEDSVRLLSRVMGDGRAQEDPASAAALALSCGNLPLAMRIAAARLAARPHWTLAAMADRLACSSTPLDELRHGELAVRESVAQTYELLEEPVRRLYRLLGLLETVDFGEWVVGPLLGDVGDVAAGPSEDMLAELVEMHLLDVDVVGGHPRYRFHELIRAFARERSSVEDATSVRRAALERVHGALLTLAEAAHRASYGGDFLVVSGPAVRHPVPDAVLRQVERAPSDWYGREIRYLTSAVLQVASLAVPALAWELALRSVVGFEAHIALAAWRETHSAALLAAREAGDELGQAAMSYSLGSLALHEQDLPAAGRLLEDAERRFVALGSAMGEALVLRNRAAMDMQQGRFDDALDRGQRALRTFTEQDDPLGRAFVLRQLAQHAVDVGRDAEAIAELEKAARICGDLGNRRMTALILHRLGETLLSRDDPDRADVVFTQVLGIVRETGDQIGEAYALLGACAVALRRGRWSEADALAVRARELTERTCERRVGARVELATGTVRLAAGQPERALEILLTARRLFRALPEPVQEAEALLFLGRAAEALDDPSEARRYWSEGLDVLGGIGRRFGARLAEKLTDHLEAGLPR